MFWTGPHVLQGSNKLPYGADTAGTWTTFSVASLYKTVKEVQVQTLGCSIHTKLLIQKWIL